MFTIVCQIVKFAGNFLKNSKRVRNTKDIIKVLQTPLFDTNTNNWTLCN